MPQQNNIYAPLRDAQLTHDFDKGFLKKIIDAPLKLFGLTDMDYPWMRATIKISNGKAQLVTGDAGIKVLDGANREDAMTLANFAVNRINQVLKANGLYGKKGYNETLVVGGSSGRSKTPDNQIGLFIGKPNYVAMGTDFWSAGAKATDFMGLKSIQDFAIALDSYVVKSAASHGADVSNFVLPSFTNGGPSFKTSFGKVDNTSSLARIASGLAYAAAGYAAFNAVGGSAGAAGGSGTGAAGGAGLTAHSGLPGQFLASPAASGTIGAGGASAAGGVGTLVKGVTGFLAENKGLIEAGIDIGVPLLTKWLFGDDADEMMELREDLMGTQINIAQKQLQLAQEQWNRFKEIYGPVEERLRDQVMNPEDIEARVQRERARAAADVESQYGISFDSYQRDLARYGLDPSDPRFAHQAYVHNLNKAKDKVGHMNRVGTDTRDYLEERNYKRMADFVNMGRGLPNNAGEMMRTAGYGMSSAEGIASGLYRDAIDAQYNLSNSITSLMHRALDRWTSTGPQPQRQGGFPGTGTTFNNQDGVYFRHGGLVRAPKRSGGATYGLAHGGQVRGPGGVDNVPARLTAGEYVIPKDVVLKKGTEFFEKLVEKYHDYGVQR